MTQNYANSDKLGWFRNILGSQKIIFIKWGGHNKMILVIKNWISGKYPPPLQLGTREYNQYWISVGWLNKSSYLTLPSFSLLISGILHWNFYCLLMSYLIIPLLILLVNSLPFVFWSFFFAILLLYTGFSNPCLLGILILAILHRTFSKIFKSLTS